MAKIINEGMIVSEVYVDFSQASDNIPLGGIIWKISAHSWLDEKVACP